MDVMQCGTGTQCREAESCHAVREGDVMRRRRDELYKSACFPASRPVIYQRLLLRLDGIVVYLLPFTFVTV